MMRLFWPAACGVFLLAGCATTRQSHLPLSVSEQQALLQQLPGFRFEGRAGARAGEEGFNVPNLSWRQNAAESSVRLSGLLGAGGLTLLFSPQSLQVTTSLGDEYAGDEAASILSAELGFVPPFAALRYWVVGLDAPGEIPVDLQTDADGRLIQMTQQGWQIRYDRRVGVATRYGEIQLPQRLIATRGDWRLVLVVDRWKLQAAD